MHQVVSALVVGLTPIYLWLTIGVFTTSLFIWLFFNHGFDKIFHPQEWHDAGSAGERILYRTLIDELGIPEKQFLRNLYLPRRGGKTAELDLVLISKKAMFVFECKNYDGQIYGDGRRRTWAQYLHGRRYHFYNPLWQNRNHARYLKEFLASKNLEVPIIPLLATITRGQWHLKNLKPDDYVMGYNCHFREIYRQLPDSPTLAANYEQIMTLLSPLSRPDESIKQKHRQQIKRR